MYGRFTIRFRLEVQPKVGPGLKRLVDGGLSTGKLRLRVSEYLSGLEGWGFEINAGLPVEAPTHTLSPRA